MDPNNNPNLQSSSPSAPQPQQQMPQYPQIPQQYSQQQMPQQQMPQQQMPQQQGFAFNVPFPREQFQQHFENLKNMELKQEPSFVESIPSATALREASKRFKIHAAIAVIFSTVMIGIWTFLQLWIWTGFPWFFYPVCTCGLTLSFHYYLFNRPTKEILNLHVAWYILINIVLFFTWAADTSKSTWFLFVALGWGILLAIHFCLVKYKEHPSRLLYTHLSAFIILSLLLFVIYLNQPDKGFAWPIVVMLGLGVILLIHWNQHYHKGNYFRLHATLFADLQFLLFMCWEMSGPGHFPFFLPPLAVWTAILAIHFWKKSRSDAAISKQQQQSDVSAAFSVEETQTPLMQEQQLNPFEAPAYGTTPTPTGYAYPQVVVLQNPSMYPQVNPGMPQQSVLYTQPPRQNP